MAVDYALRRFRTYLIGSQHENAIATDHLPLLNVFNGKRSGSIRTERIKLRHQNILLCLKSGKECDNLAGYLSRHTTQWKSVSKSKREESNYFSKLLCTLYATPVFRCIGNSGDYRTY